MEIDDKFEKWFDEKFPEKNFGNLAGAFRIAMKTDIAKKAFVYGLKCAVASYSTDTKLYSELLDYLEIHG